MSTNFLCLVSILAPDARIDCSNGKSFISSLNTVGAGVWTDSNGGTVGSIKYMSQGTTFKNELTFDLSMDNMSKIAVAAAAVVVAVGYVLFVYLLSSYNPSLLLSVSFSRANPGSQRILQPSGRAVEQSTSCLGYCSSQLSLSIDTR